MASASTSAPFPIPEVQVEGGALGLGDGLLMLLREALEPLAADVVLAIRTPEPGVAHDLPAWCRIMGHAYLGSEPTPTGANYYLRKGKFRSTAVDEKPDWGIRLPLPKGGELHTADWFVG